MATRGSAPSRASKAGEIIDKNPTSLHDLPDELLWLIMQNLDSPSELHTLLSTSRNCFHLFQASPSYRLRTTLQNWIVPEVLSIALAAISVPEVSHLTWRARATTIEHHLDCLLEIEAFHELSMPTEMPELTKLSRVCFRISRFINHYHDRSLRALGELLDHADKRLPTWATNTIDDSAYTVRILPLSVTERTRLQRAFFHYELYCKVFQPMPSTSPEFDAGSLSNPHPQFSFFFRETGTLGSGRDELCPPILYKYDESSASKCRSTLYKDCLRNPRIGISFRNLTPWSIAHIPGTSED